MLTVLRQACLLLSFSSSALALSAGEVVTALSRGASQAQTLLLSDRLIWTAVQLPIALSDSSGLLRVVEVPLGRVGTIVRPTVTDIVNYILQYRGLADQGDRETLVKEARRYEYVLHLRVPCFPRRGVSAKQRCPLPAVHRTYRDRWAAALAAKHSAGPDQKAKADATLARARRDWDLLGYRAVFGLALAHTRTRDEAASEILWNDLELQFLEQGGAAFRLNGTHPRPEFIPSIESIISGDRLPTLMLDVQNAASGSVIVPIYLVRIRRPWIDVGVFWQYRWRWDRSSPLGTGYKISSATGCSSAEPLPCIGEWLIIVPSLNGLDEAKLSASPGGPHVIGVVGEALPAAPPFSTAPADIGAERVRRAADRSNIFSRLRSGTF